jgi:DNA polymerase-3 subunit gamma/tau
MAKRQPAPAQEASAPEGYTVLARRYRPQQFADLIGQEPVVRALVNALQSNRVAHAYLFTGARGVGKTSTARILAKALNCEKGPTPTPCDACDACRRIAVGEDVDVLEIDGASNRGIDEIREIRSNVQYRPQRARFKIYIVDEVHMLTAPAFNALLKTLEEPPPHVKFIFATTEVQKIPITILSRCQRFDFAGIGTSRIVEQLRKVVAAEGMQADDEALELIARRAAGSMRDAESLLDQLLAFGGERLTAEQVHGLLGTANDERVVALAGAVLDHDPKRALELLAQAADQGLQLGELLDQLIDYWRDLMVVHCAGAEARDLSVTARHRETLQRQAAALKLDTILAGLDILASTKARFRFSGHGRILLEMALVRLGRLDDLASLTELAQWLSQSPARPAAPARIAAPPANPSLPRLSPSPESEKKKPVPAPELRPVSRSTAPVRSDTSDLVGEAIPGELTEESLPRVWAQVLSQVGPILAMHLGRAESIAISGPNTLAIRFPAAYNADQEFCQEPTRLPRIEEALRKCTGQIWKLRFESVRGDGLSQPPATAEATDNSPSRQRRLQKEAEKEPLVKRVIEVLGAQLVRVDEGFGAAPTEAVEGADPADSEES